VLTFATANNQGPFVTDNYWLSLMGIIIFICCCIFPVLLITSSEFERKNLILDTEILKSANAKLKQISNTDSLTHCFNRRYFDEYLAIEWEKAKIAETPLSIITIDVDHFKAYNDYYGHSAGDNCLIEIVKQLNVFIKRPSDLLARYGGEEFVIILPNMASAKNIAEQCCSAIENLKIEHKKSLTSDFITISAGFFTVMPSTFNDSKSFLNLADQYLYQAKSEGRNRVCGPAIKTRAAPVLSRSG
jgi:diguanylate cyclase (GGDEF)-like protein